MPYYLTDLIDIGVNPRGRFRPRGFDQSAHWAILRLDGVKVVLWSATTISLAGVDLVADSKDEAIALVTRNALSAMRGDSRQIPGRFGDAVGDLLLNPPNSRWPALRSMNDGVFRVKMGSELVWSALDPAGSRRASVQAVDDFNRTDGNLNGSTSSDAQFTWTETVGTLWTVTSNTARFTGATNGSGVAQSGFTLDTDDMDVQGVLSITHLSNDTTCGVVARGGTADLGAAGSGYLFLTYNNSSEVKAFIFDGPNGAALTEDIIAAEGGTYKITVNGSALEIFRNGSSINSTTDTSITGVNKGGIYAFTQGSTDVINIDDFLIQDVGFGGGGGGNPYSNIHAPWFAFG